MDIKVSTKAFLKTLFWCHEAPEEVSCMGQISAESEVLLIEDVHLVKQEVGSASVDLDMKSWADKVAELYETYGIQPWQLQVWIHTHPMGLKGFSQQDVNTIEEKLSSWDHVVALVMTEKGEMSGRVAFTSHFPWGDTRHSEAASVIIQANSVQITEEELETWRNEFKSLVKKQRIYSSTGFYVWDEWGEYMPNSWRLNRYKEKATTKPSGAALISPPSPKVVTVEDKTKVSEVTKPLTYLDYIRLCGELGMNPASKSTFSKIYNRKPSKTDMRVINSQIKYLKYGGI